MLIEISGYASGKNVDGKHLIMVVVGYIGGRGINELPG
jgi:hypothetical protein